MKSLGFQSLGLRLYRLVGRCLGRARNKTALAQDYDNPDDIYGFAGWKMQTMHAKPWAHRDHQLTSRDEIGEAFASAHDGLRDRIKSGGFHLTQFNLNDRSREQDIDRTLDGLRWRHYVVFWSAWHAAKTVSALGSVAWKYNLLEAGVCDGLTAYFAFHGSKMATGASPNLTLLDAWAPMRASDFGSLDSPNVGKYSYLRAERTVQNLSDEQTSCRFVVGYIPEVLDKVEIEGPLTWLHIDLNSAKGTEHALKCFAPQITAGGICLLDDYGWRGYWGTKAVVDAYFRGTSRGHFMVLPTGQGVWFCDS